MKEIVIEGLVGKTVGVRVPLVALKKTVGWAGAAAPGAAGLGNGERDEFPTGSPCFGRLVRVVRGLDHELGHHPPGHPFHGPGLHVVLAGRVVAGVAERGRDHVTGRPVLGRQRIDALPDALLEGAHDALEVRYLG